MPPRFRDSIHRLPFTCLAIAAVLSSPLAVAQSPTEPRHYDRHRRLAAASPFKEVPWQLVGPTNVSGRITDVAVARRPGQTRVLYVGLPTGYWPGFYDFGNWVVVLLRG